MANITNEISVDGKKYREKTATGWNWYSFITKAKDILFGDGTDLTNSVENNLGAIKGITTSTNVTETGYAADASVVSTLNSNLANGQIKFGVDADGNYGYIKAGADTVIPFKSKNKTYSIPIDKLTFSYEEVVNGSISVSNAKINTCATHGEPNAKKTVSGYAISNEWIDLDLPSYNYLLIYVTNSSNGGTDAVRATLFLVDENGNRHTFIQNPIGTVNGYSFRYLLSTSELSIPKGKYKLKIWITGAADAYGYPADWSYLTFTNEKMLLV